MRFRNPLAAPFSTFPSGIVVLAITLGSLTACGRSQIATNHRGRMSEGTTQPPLGGSDDGRNENLPDESEHSSTTSPDAPSPENPNPAPEPNPVPPAPLPTLAPIPNVPVPTGAQFLPCLPAGTIATIDLYARAPGIEQIAHLAGCAVPSRTGGKGGMPASMLALGRYADFPAGRKLRAAFADQSASSVARRARIERQIILDLAIRLARLPSMTGRTTTGLNRDQLLTLLQREFIARGKLRQSELPFTARDAVVANFDARLRGQNRVAGGTLASSQFPAWKFEWSRDDELLETQAFDQFVYKSIAQWTYVRLSGELREDVRTPSTFAQIAITAATEVAREKARIQDGEPSVPNPVRPLDRQLKPVIPFLLVDEPVYLMLPASDAGIATTTAGSKYSAIVMDLMLANRFQEIQKDLAAKGVKTLITMGSYNHRFIARTTTFSRHSYGTAIDISGFIFRDGKKGMIKSVYKTGTRLMAKGADPVVYARMNDIRDYLEGKNRNQKSKPFDVVMGPGQRDHSDHFHVDLEPMKRPTNYSLSSTFDSLFALSGWSVLQSWFYIGKTPWAQSLNLSKDAVLPTFLSRQVRELETHPDESVLQSIGRLDGSPDSESVGFTTDQAPSTCND